MKDLDKRNKEMLIMALDGKSCKELAKEFGCDVSYIRRILNNNFGLGASQRLDIRNKLILDRYKGGCTIKSISEEFNLKTLTIKEILRDKYSIIVYQDSIDKRHDTIKSYYKNGMSIVNISKKMGLTTHQIGIIVKGIYKTKKCKLCGTEFHTKSHQEYCKNCGDKKYLHTDRQIQCNECGRIIKAKYLSMVTRHDRGKVCSRYCQYLSFSRKASLRLKEIIRRHKNGEDHDIIRKDLNMGRRGYNDLIKRTNIYLNLPPLYWSSDQLVLKYNKWESSRTRTELLLRAKQERRKFDSWKKNNTTH